MVKSNFCLLLIITRLNIDLSGIKNKHFKRSFYMHVETHLNLYCMFQRIFGVKIQF